MERQQVFSHTPHPLPFSRKLLFKDFLNTSCIFALTSPLQFSSVNECKHFLNPDKILGPTSFWKQ